ncbi:MAG: L-rhamnose mutarotase [Verrucomicrobiae bacterium]|nr:L-rhamnose mutarotase [Verrucomicrobiae bacterium]
MEELEHRFLRISTDRLQLVICNSANVLGTGVIEEQHQHYFIFPGEETHALFAYAEIESEERWDAIAETDVCQRWWLSMKGLMPAHADNSSVSSPLREVFHIAEQ